MFAGSVGSINWLDHLQWTCEAFFFLQNLCFVCSKHQNVHLLPRICSIRHRAGCEDKRAFCHPTFHPCSTRQTVSEILRIFIMRDGSAFRAHVGRSELPHHCCGDIRATLFQSSMNHSCLHNPNGTRASCKQHRISRCAFTDPTLITASCAEMTCS